jgi:hypothetical protein
MPLYTPKGFSAYQYWGWLTEMPMVWTYFQFIDTAVKACGTKTKNSLRTAFNGLGSDPQTSPGTGQAGPMTPSLDHASQPRYSPGHIDSYHET